MRRILKLGMHEVEYVAFRLARELMTRIAVMTVLVFLAKNEKWLSVSNNVLYKIAVSVAESDAKDKDAQMAMLEALFKEGLVRGIFDYPWKSANG